MILVSIAIFMIAYLVHYFTSQEHIGSYLDQECKVTKTFRYGFVIKYEGNNVFIRSNDVFHEGDILKIQGRVTPITGKMKDYMYQNNIINQVYWPKIHVLARATNIRINFTN